MLNMERRGKTRTRARTERGEKIRGKGEEGKREKGIKGVDETQRDGGERRNREGEPCDSKGQRKAVKVAKQAAEMKT